MAASIDFDFGQARDNFKDIVRQSASQSSAADCLTYVEGYEGSDSDKKPALDQAFRDVLKDFIIANRGCDEYMKLITIAIDAAEKDVCSATAPFLMLADVFDMITLSECEIVFNLVEDKVHTWRSEMFFEAGKNYLLRMCNDLLRRLSKSQNTVFCGRIQMFLARLFPLSEKSALNLMSQFNLENITVFTSTQADIKPKKAETDTQMEVEEGETDEQTSSVPIDYNLYRRFWSLQDFFRKPTQCFDKTQWKMFALNADPVLNAFASSKLDDVKSSRKKLNVPRPGQTDTFFAKYLTSEKLLDLQLNDSYFRRYILVQFLILFQYLNSPVKFKSSNQVLTEDQSTWVKATQEKIYVLLRETPPDGEQFAKTVEHVLKREENWNNWKNDGCPKFEREPTGPAPEATSKPKQKSKRKRIGDDLQSTGGKVIRMGNAELTKLWNLNPDNMEACKAEKRLFLPSLEEFFTEAVEQTDPEAMVEEEYKLTNDQIYQWKSLRLLARRSPHFFNHSNNPAQPLNIYLNQMLTKLAKEIPIHSSETQSSENAQSSAETQAGEEMKTEVGEEEDIKETQEEEEEVVEEEEKQKKEQRFPLFPDVRKKSGEILDNTTLDDDSPITRNHAAAVADMLGEDWKKLAVKLKFPEDDIDYFQSENQENNQRANKVVTIWQENEGNGATLGILKAALRDIGRSDIFKSVFGIL
ncbi:hypothetical protein ACJMK2_040988 [Sinanodonta woodiana]|uniref:Death domain-containing protein n=1 Tax=Sinanodonta woodiana TaxID=1069815 RepID=A0ABD3W2S2_SINWO